MSFHRRYSAKQLFHPRARKPFAASMTLFVIRQLTFLAQQVTNQVVEPFFTSRHTSVSRRVSKPHNFQIARQCSPRHKWPSISRSNRLRSSFASLKPLSPSYPVCTSDTNTKSRQHPSRQCPLPKSQSIGHHCSTLPIACPKSVSCRTISLLSNTYHKHFWFALLLCCSPGEHAGSVVV